MASSPKTPSHGQLSVSMEFRTQTKAKTQRPDSPLLRVRVLADHTGTPEALEGRLFPVDLDSFETLFRKLTPSLPWDGSVVTFSHPEEMHPDRLWPRPEFSSGSSEPPSADTRTVPGSTSAPAAAENLLDELLQKPAQASPDPILRSPGNAVVESIVRQALEGHRPPPTAASAADPAVRGRAILSFLHNPTFLQMDAFWRFFSDLVHETDTDDPVRWELCPVSKATLAEWLQEPDSSPLQRWSASAEDEPASLFVLTHSFEESDQSLLEALVHWTSLTRSPVLANASPALAGLPGRMTAVEEIKQSPAWLDSLRLHPGAHYLALSTPGCLARYPFGSKGEPWEAWPGFEEDMPADPIHLPFAPASLACTRAWIRHWVEEEELPRGVCSLGGLPLWPKSGGGQWPVTGYWLTETQAARIHRNGLLPLISVKNADYVLVPPPESLNGTPLPIQSV